MVVDPEPLARFGALLADRTRAAMCLALMDGRAWTVGELARHARVAMSTASEHVSRLVEAGLVDQRRQGRHRYVRLRDDAAHLVEEITALTMPMPTPRPALRQVRAHHALLAARTCYDHLAGRLGVAVFDAMTRRDLLAAGDGLALTARGHDWFAALGADLTTARRGRRPLVRSCLDWTERRPHLAGAAGAALLRVLREREWVAEGSRRRAVTVTAPGREALGRLLGMEAEAV